MFRFQFSIERFYFHSQYYIFYIEKTNLKIVSIFCNQYFLLFKWAKKEYSYIISIKKKEALFHLQV